MQQTNHQSASHSRGIHRVDSKKRKEPQILRADNKALHDKMSRYQLNMMDNFWAQGPDFILPVGHALKDVDLRTFDSLNRRGYLEFQERKKGFKCTLFGWHIKGRWEEAPPQKKHASDHFGAFLRRENPSLSGKFRVLVDADDESNVTIKPKESRKTRVA